MPNTRLVVEYLGCHPQGVGFQVLGLPKWIELSQVKEKEK